jgi:hypothetical protein
MKHTDPAAVLSCELLRFVRDRTPTEAEFLAWLGGPASAGIDHVLRKAGLVTLRDGRVELSPRYLSPDGKTFSFENRLFHIDLDRVSIFSRGPLPSAESLTA